MTRLLRFVLVPAALLAPLAASGQSLLSAGGLGLRVEPVDATARALGGVVTGSMTPRILPGYPTASLDLLAPSLTFTGQPSWGDFTLGDQEGTYQGTRFPIVGFSIPVDLRSVITFTLASRFDQRWQVSGVGTAELGENTVATDDVFESDGGLSELRLGYARWLSANVAVGATAGLYRGKVNRTFIRQFDTVSVANPITAFVNGGKWTFFGPTASVDVQWDPIRLLRLGARVSWSGTLEAKPTIDTEGSPREIEMPLEISVGATAILTPGLDVSVGLETANWSELGDPAFDEAASGRVTSLGAGLEWTAGSFWAGEFPLRLGFRRSDLPFALDADGASETIWSAGFGVIMAQSQGFPLATLDLAGELGSRDSGALEESFRRVSLTFRISGL